MQTNFNNKFGSQKKIMRMRGEHVHDPEWLRYVIFKSALKNHVNKLGFHSLFFKFLFAKPK